jgi:hypothetical protein
MVLFLRLSTMVLNMSKIHKITIKPDILCVYTSNTNRCNCIMFSENEKLVIKRGENPSDYYILHNWINTNT